LIKYSHINYKIELKINLRQTQISKGQGINKMINKSFKIQLCLLAIISNSVFIFLEFKRLTI